MRKILPALIVVRLAMPSLIASNSMDTQNIRVREAGTFMTEEEEGSEEVAVTAVVVEHLVEEEEEDRTYEETQHK